MMNVPEKLDFMMKRRKYFEKKEKESGITADVKNVLEQRGMVP